MENQIEMHEFPDGFSFGADRGAVLRRVENAEIWHRKGYTRRFMKRGLVADPRENPEKSMVIGRIFLMISLEFPRIFLGFSRNWN